MLYLASDHAGFPLKQSLLEDLTANGFSVEDLTPQYQEGDDYPDAAKILADKLHTEKDSFGVAICGTGQGMCMALNRYSWIRAGTTDDGEIVKLLRQHNDANVLCLAGRFVSPEQALDLTRIFISQSFSQQERHQRRIDKISGNTIDKTS